MTDPPCRARRVPPEEIWLETYRLVFTALRPDPGAPGSVENAHCLAELTARKVLEEYVRVQHLSGVSDAL